MPRTPYLIYQSIILLLLLRPPYNFKSEKRTERFRTYSTELSEGPQRKDNRSANQKKCRWSYPALTGRSDVCEFR